MKVVFENDWMQIIEVGEKYTIRYNSGDLVNSICEVIVSKVDAMEAQVSDKNAYEVILKYQNLERLKTD